MNINQADLNELEFPELLAEIAPFAYSPKTADNIMELRPMEIDEAILQMNMLEHEFFVFRNAQTNEINVVYKRHDGNYALIEPEAE